MEFSPSKSSTVEAEMKSEAGHFQDLATSVPAFGGTAVITIPTGLTTIEGGSLINRGLATQGAIIYFTTDANDSAGEGPTGVFAFVIDGSVSEGDTFGDFIRCNKAWGEGSNIKLELQNADEIPQTVTIYLTYFVFGV